MISQWKSILAAQGFKRVVCVQTNEGEKIDGSIVLDDSRFSDIKHNLTQNSDSR
jgi:hypothetical protein